MEARGTDRAGSTVVLSTARHLRPVRGSWPRQAPQAAPGFEPAKNRVLVPVDYGPASAAALRGAVRLVSPAQTRFIVLRVLPVVTHAMSAYPSLDERRVERETARLERFVQEIEAETQPLPNVEISLAFATSPETMICELALQQSVDLIVIGPEPHRLRHRLVRSFAERLLQIAPCPVLSIPAG